jgi:hypothetical protein
MSPIDAVPEEQKHDSDRYQSRWLLVEILLSGHAPPRRGVAHVNNQDHDYIQNSRELVDSSIQSQQPSSSSNRVHVNLRLAP